MLGPGHKVDGTEECFQDKLGLRIKAAVSIPVFIGLRKKVMLVIPASKSFDKIVHY